MGGVLWVSKSSSISRKILWLRCSLSWWKRTLVSSRSRPFLPIKDPCVVSDAVPLYVGCCLLCQMNQAHPVDRSFSRKHQRSNSKGKIGIHPEMGKREDRVPVTDAWRTHATLLCVKITLEVCYVYSNQSDSLQITRSASDCVRYNALGIWTRHCWYGSMFCPLKWTDKGILCRCRRKGRVE
jgi:hypothetical protein